MLKDYLRSRFQNTREKWRNNPKRVDKSEKLRYNVNELKCTAITAEDGLQMD